MNLSTLPSVCEAGHFCLFDQRALVAYLQMNSPMQCPATRGSIQMDDHPDRYEGLADKGIIKVKVKVKVKG